MFEPPFRWNLTNRTHLGSLVRGEKAVAYDDFYMTKEPAMKFRWFRGLVQEIRS